ncbi:MAG TPA: metallophosphoesterase [Candidatus Nanoarchaeia archaeon]|nr:metallophosphoesterase [Candidatus Nanoarchaeia archaeon]
MAITYGVISDLHRIDIRTVPLTIQILKDEGIDALILNGDISGERSGHNPQEYMATVLDAAGKSGTETFVLPGSHEEVHIFEPVLAHFIQKYGNIVNTFDNPFVNKGDHHLVFLQGSDWRAGEAVHHGYSLEDQAQSGIYKNKGAYLRIVNMNDLKKLISDPDKTLVFSHVPRKFNNPEESVDMAEFWETQQQFRLGEQVCEIGSIFPGPAGYGLAKQGAPIKLKRENRGNEILSLIYTELGITKNITGHFHESAGRANDLEGCAVQEGLFVPTLFYNAACMDRLMVGMVSVDGEKVAYENVNLQKYLK